VLLLYVCVAVLPPCVPPPSPTCQGLSPEVREVSAEGLGELVGLTSEEGLKPFVVTITGPLIRIIGDRWGRGSKVGVWVGGWGGGILVVCATVMLVE